MLSNTSFQSSILVLAFFSISSSQPLLSQISLRKREPQEFETMGRALGIPDSGLLLQREPAQVMDPNEPLDKLLLDKKFRQSFTAFADRCCFSPQAPVSRCTHLCGKNFLVNQLFGFFLSAVVWLGRVSISMMRCMSVAKYL